MPIYYKSAAITLPGLTGTFTMSNFTWEFEQVKVDMPIRRGTIRVRCIPVNNPTQPKWCEIIHENVVDADTSLNRVILKIKSVITGTVEQ